MTAPGQTPWFLTRDGSREITANWDAGSFQIQAETFQSDVATGTSPLTVASTTVVANLNADLLDGQHSSAFAGASHGHTLADISDSGALAALDTVGTAQIDDDSVTLAKLPNVTEGDFLYRETALSGSLEVRSTAQVKTQLGVDTLEGRQRVAYLTDSGTQTLTGSATKVDVSGGSLTQTESDGTVISDWELYDSGSGNADSIRYTGTATKTFDVWVTLRVKHTSADSKPLEARALGYLDTGLINGGHVYAVSGSLNSAIAQGTSHFRQEIAQDEYLNWRVSYTNTGNGGSTNGRLDSYGLSVVIREI